MTDRCLDMRTSFVDLPRVVRRDKPRRLGDQSRRRASAEPRGTLSTIV